ncbi:tetratricopeptide repeat-containing sensor histidine kinase [Paucihalobacter sp.]|uniref:tetratricopeptide repeat-containing sensor histidine kinase n=1 Tax=Paucihalobacter sp. TaxID=2850405 RepID=UPI002FE3C5FD
MVKNWFSVVLVLFMGLCSALLSAQNTVQQALSKSIDSTTILIENRLTDAVVLPVIQAIREKAQTHQLIYEYASTYLIESNHHFLNSHWDAAINASQKAFEIGESMDDGIQKTEILVKALNSIGYVYSFQGDFAEGLSIRLRALEIADARTSSNLDMGNLLSWIADDYRHLYQYEKAIEYLNKTEPYLQYMTNESVVDYYYIYCQSLAALGNYSEAKTQLANLDTFIANNSTLTEYDRNIGYLQSTKLHGEFAMNDKDYNLAIEQYNKYLHHSEILKSDVHIAIAFNKIARAYQLLDNNEQALKHFKLSYDACLKDGSLDYAYKNANAIANLYAENKDFANAFSYSQSAFQLKDSLNATERVKELNFLEAKFQAGKKEKEIAELKLTNTEQELKAVRHNRVLIIGAIVASALIILLGLAYHNSRQKRIIVEKEKRAVEQQQQVLSLQAMVNGQETERTRIAKDLHDSLGGAFSTIKMHLSSLEHDLKKEQNIDLLQKCIQIVGNTATEVRRIAHNMMPEVLIKLGLLHSVQELADNISSSKQLKVRFQHFGIQERLTSNFEIMLYRIVQELLNNIIKHSNATEAIVQFIKENNRLSITVEDNGNGFSGQEATKGIGLASVKERVQYLNGSLSIDSESSVGTTVMMEFLLSET